jgi:hypothetical protein
VREHVKNEIGPRPDGDFDAHVARASISARGAPSSSTPRPARSASRPRTYAIRVLLARGCVGRVRARQDDQEGPQLRVVGREVVFDDVEEPAGSLDALRSATYLFGPCATGSWSVM